MTGQRSPPHGARECRPAGPDGRGTPTFQSSGPAIPVGHSLMESLAGLRAERSPSRWRFQRCPGATGGVLAANDRRIIAVKVTTTWKNGGVSQKRKKGSSKPRMAPNVNAARKPKAARDISAVAHFEKLDGPTAWRHYDRLLAYEEWVRAGRVIADARPDTWPFMYRTANAFWPEAFEFLRHSAFQYVSKALGVAPWADIIDSLARRVSSEDPAGADALRDALAGAHARFLRQYREAFAAMEPSLNRMAKVARARVGLQSYAAIYETDLPIWFLGVVGQALTIGKVDPGFLGGPASPTPQGSMLNTVADVLKETPLYVPFTTAYSRELRNALGHNDYELTTTGDSFSLVDSSTGQTWSERDVWNLISSSQTMVQAVLMVAQSLLSRQGEDQFADCGVTSFTYDMTVSGTPVVVVAQLWCFRDLDPRGNWLARAELSIEQGKGGLESASLTPRARLSGSPISNTEVGRACAETGWVCIRRVPVAPNLGRGLPIIRSAEGELLEVVGVPDVHYVPVK